MKLTLLATALAVSLAATTAMPSAAMAKDHHRDHHYDRHYDRHQERQWDAAAHYRRGNYRPRRLTRNDRIYRGNDGRYYCRRSDGTAGLIIGGVAGGLLGHAVSGDTVGTVIGAGGGALLGKSIAQGKLECR